MRRLIALILLCLTLNAGAAGMSEVTYMDQEGQGGGYVTRYLQTERYLRMDFGRDRDDFVLYDRVQKRVYNVLHDRRQIMVIDAAPVQISVPKDWRVKDDVLDANEAKTRVDLSVNGRICSRLTASQRFLPEMRLALQEFTEAMVATQAATYAATPAEQRDPCDLARLILEPQRWFKYGLAMDELRDDGFSRRLLSYSADLALRPSLFELPADYRQINIKQMRGEAP